jgi:hypothetical protein
MAAQLVQLGQPDPDGALALITKIVRGVPGRPGPACVGRYDLIR